MLTKISIKQFKKLDATIDLDRSVVFVGPNNSGKTTGLQAIALWELGLRKWAEKRKKSKAKERNAATINRKDILYVPVPQVKLLWKDLQTRKSIIDIKGNRITEHIKMEIEVEGYTQGKQWKVGLEFDYANQESLYCKTIQNHNDESLVSALMEKVGYLPPMSGLVSIEDKLEKGSILSRIGQGRTAEVIRNLCWSVSQDDSKWQELKKHMHHFFGVDLENASYDPENGQITMSYKESGKEIFDLSCEGTGFQQVLLILSYLYAFPNTILLLDEPDAHLEIIRQKQIYHYLADVVSKQNSQLIISTHSEKILSEAMESGKVISFPLFGKPHLLNDKKHVIKSLTTIGYDQYFLARQKRYVLYLEGSTDLEMLKSFAEVLNHPVKNKLDTIFLKPVSNKYTDARSHFVNLQYAVPDLIGLAVFDNMDIPSQPPKGLKELVWQRNEIENYLTIPEVIYRYLEPQQNDLFSQHDPVVMKEFIEDIIPRKAQKDKLDSWWFKTKISDELLNIVFKKYFQRMGMPVSTMEKGQYHKLALLSKVEEIDLEVAQ
jgi:predicted ATPase